MNRLYIDFVLTSHQVVFRKMPECRLLLLFYPPLKDNLPVRFLAQTFCQLFYLFRPQHSLLIRLERYELNFRSSFLHSFFFLLEDLGDGFCRFGSSGEGALNAPSFVLERSETKIPLDGIDY